MLRSAEYRQGGQRLSGSQSFGCRVCRKSVAMIKGSLQVCDEWCTISCDACRITNLAVFFGFANPSGFLFFLRKPFRFFVFPSQTLQVFCFSFANPSGFLFGPSQKGTICSSDGTQTNVFLHVNLAYYKWTIICIDDPSCKFSHKMMFMKNDIVLHTFQLL